jgi:hypothetical protein
MKVARLFYSLRCSVDQIKENALVPRKLLERQASSSSSKSGHK